MMGQIVSNEVNVAGLNSRGLKCPIENISNGTSETQNKFKTRDSLINKVFLVK